MGDADGDHPMSDTLALSIVGIDIIYVMEMEAWQLVAQRPLVPESLGLEPMDLGSISRMRWNVEDRATTSWGCPLWTRSRVKAHSFATLGTVVVVHTLLYCYDRLFCLLELSKS